LQVVVVPFIGALGRQAPGIRVAVRPVEGESTRTRLERGELDLALLTPESTPPDLHVRKLFDETYVCAVRQGHPAIVSGKISLDRFCSLNHALVSYAGDRFWGATDEALARIGRSRKITLSVASFLVLGDVLRTTDLIAVAPRRSMEAAEGLTLFAPPIEVPGFAKVAAWHERTHMNPGQRWIRALLFDSCGESSG
jgi:DNA-binding transcriptional LysR family regulator